MSLQQKSDRSVEAAEYLQTQDLHCSSIHCYYYACFQMLCHKLFQKYSDRQLEAIRNDTTTRGGIHVKYLLRYVRDLRHISIDQHSIVEFQENMQYLKKLRTKADYKPYLTTNSNNIKAQQLATDCLAVINSPDFAI